MKSVHTLPDLPIDINEYADKPEQNPANSVYYIAQLERHNLRGLRANWGSKSALHDYLANLVLESNGMYHPNGEWQLYKYYAQMTGDRVATTASADLRFDVFATKSGSSVKIIAGTRTIHAPYEIRISGLRSLGLPAKGSVSVDVLRFDWAGDQGQVGTPVKSTTTFAYSADTVRYALAKHCEHGTLLILEAVYTDGSTEQIDCFCIRNPRLGTMSIRWFHIIKCSHSTWVYDCDRNRGH